METSLRLPLGVQFDQFVTHSLRHPAIQARHRKRVSVGFLDMRIPCSVCDDTPSRSVRTGAYASPRSGSGTSRRAPGCRQPFACHLLHKGSQALSVNRRPGRLVCPVEGNPVPPRPHPTSSGLKGGRKPVGFNLGQAPQSRLHRRSSTGTRRSAAARSPDRRLSPPTSVRGTGRSVPSGTPCRSPSSAGAAPRSS